MDVTEASWLGLLELAQSLDPDPVLAHLSDHDVEQEVRDGASRLAALECAWLVHVSELVVRGVWADQGARTPGQWLSWACGLDGSTGREKVRVALALRHLPRIRARFAEGTLSYSKVRVLTRVAVPEIEEQLIMAADSAPASQLARILAASRRSADESLRWQEGPPDAPDGEVRGFERLVVDEGVVEFRVRLPVDEAMAVEERLDRLVDLADRAEVARDDGGSAGVDAGERLDAADGEDGADEVAGGSVARPPRGARRARALADALAVAVADGAPDRSGADDHLVVLHVPAGELVAAVDDGAASADAPEVTTNELEPADGAASSAGAASADAPAGAPALPRALVSTGRGRGMMLPRRALAWLTCDANLRLAGIAEGGHPADIGRRSRTVPADLRRALQVRDRHCRFPGCHQTRGLHAHHVIHWAAGGPTDLSNLVLVCAHHHRFVHDRGWELRPVAGQPGRWTFHASGSTDPHPPALPMPGASADALAQVRTLHPPPQALQPPWWDGEGYDLDETVRVFSEMLLDVAA